MDLEKATQTIGKRVIVSIRMVRTGQDDEFSGYWGVIQSVDDGGFLVKIEGGSDEVFEMLPPDLDLLEPAKFEFYEFKGGTVVEQVDYEAYLVSADSVEELRVGQMLH